MVNIVQVSRRLTDSPALILSQMTTGMRQFMQMMDKNMAQEATKNLTLEINPNHEIIVKMNELRKKDSSFGSMMAKQLLDNSMMSTGMLSDSKAFLNRVTKLMTFAMDSKLAGNLIGDQGGAVREEESSKSEANSVNAESILKEAFMNVNKQKNQREEVSAEIEIGPDGKPIVK